MKCVSCGLELSSDVYICPECFEFVIRSSDEDTEEKKRQADIENSFIPTFELDDKDILDYSPPESEYALTNPAQIDKEYLLADELNTPIEVNDDTIKANTLATDNDFEKAEELNTAPASTVNEFKNNFISKDNYYLSKYSDAEILSSPAQPSKSLAIVLLIVIIILIVLAASMYIFFNNEVNMLINFVISLLKKYQLIH